MPNAANNTAQQVVEQLPQEPAAAQNGMYQSMRKKYDHYFSLTHDKLGLASTAQTLPVKQWIESINPTDTEQILEAEKWFQKDYSKKMDAALDLYHRDFLPPLQKALTAGVISQSSCTEWISWIRDSKRDYKEKEASISSTLPDYLEKRYKLASKRQAILRDPRMSQMENSIDPNLKALVAKISDDSYFLESLSYAEREDLIVEVLNAFPIATSEAKLFKEFTADLDAAVTSGLISEKSKKKWIARFKDPTVNPTAKKYFVRSQFPSYKAAWQKVKTERETLLKNPLLKEVTPDMMSDIDTFKEGKKFLELHHDKKTNMLSEVRAAIKAHEKNKRLLHSETKNVMQAAVTAGYVSSTKIGPWIEHVMEGKRTLDELKNFVKDWAKVRYRFDQIEKTMTHEQIPQGLQRISLDAFLNLSYEQRVSYVEEVERRLHIENTNPKDTPIQDAKGKVRHALDIEDWEEAKRQLAKAWTIAETSEDIAELQSMEKFLRSFGEGDSTKEGSEDSEKEITEAHRIINETLKIMPPEARPFFEESLRYGAGATWCTGVMFYNVRWCLDRGFLPDDLSQVREQAAIETPERLRPGGGHNNGLENNLVDGFRSPAIREEGVGPQNICTSSSEAATVAQSANTHQNDWSYWYWNNLVVKGLSASQYTDIATVHRRKLVSAANTLDKYGLRYNPTYNLVGPANPSVN